MEHQRRFPAPWFVHRVSKDKFQVLDASGRPLANVDCGVSDHLGELEAWTIAKAIARLPEFLNKPDDSHWDLVHPVMKRILKQ